MKESTVEKANTYAVPSAKLAREKAIDIAHAFPKSNDTKASRASQLSKAALVTANY